MSKAIADIESFRAQLRPNLVNYLSSCGVKLNGKQLFSCINPEHVDEDPSCGIVPESNGTYFNCFGCGIHGDVFKAAALLEGKPEDGPGFITENVFYIAKMYGQEVPQIEMSEEELYEYKIRQAYSDAAYLVMQSTPGPLVNAKLAEYAWSSQVLKSLGIGGISSYEEFLSKLMKQGNYTKQFLHDVDLDNKNIFSPHCLIYTVRDEKGYPVGFAARNLMYDSLKKEYEVIVAEHGEHSPEAKAAKKKLPTKYYNSTEHDASDSTKVKNTIYQKGKRLFGFHIAKKNGNPLYVFEGYSDCATAHSVGLTNSCAIGSTSFTKDHLNVIIGTDYRNGPKIRHVVFCLDADTAGDKGTERFMKLVDEVLGGNVGFTVEVLTLPAGSDDPDAFIRKSGLKAFTALPRTSVLQWRMDRALVSGEPAATVAEKMARLIVNEPTPPVRFELSKQVAEKLHMPAEVVYDMVKMLVDEDRQKLEAQRNVLAKQAVQQIQKDPSRLSAVVEQISMQLQSLGAEISGYNPKTIIDSIRHSRHRARTSTSAKRLLTGWQQFDEKFGGIPVGPAFIAVPGKPNQGKTSWMVNCFWRVVTHNPEAIAFYHTMDDAMNIFLPRVLGSKYNIPSVYFQETADFETYLKSNQQFDKIEEGDKWLDDMIVSQRFGAADSSVLPRDIGALATYVRDLRRQFPQRPLVIFADNFAHYDIRHGAPSEGEGRTQFIARFAKDLAIRYDTAIIMTMELPKESLKPGVRPRVSSIKGTSSIAYEASANIGVYNDLKDYGPKATLYWEDKNDQETYIGPNEESLLRPKRKPVIELVFDKSKLFKGFDGCIYYKLYPETGHYEECSGSDQTFYSTVAQEPKEEELPPWRGGNHSAAGAYTGSSGPKAYKAPPKPHVENVSDDDYAHFI